MPDTKHTDRTTIELAGKMDASLKSATDKAVSSLDRIAKAAEHANQKAEAFGEKIKHLGEITGAVALGEMLAHGIEHAIDKLKEFSVEGLKAAAAFETRTRALGSLLGSQELGAEMAERLEKMGIRFHGGGAALTLTAQHLKAFGVSNKNILGQTSGLANIVSGAGSPEKLEEFTAIYGRILASGKITARQISALGLMNIPIIDELKKLTGLTVPELVKAHKLTSGLFGKVLEDFTRTGGKFAKGMEQWSNTFQGAEDEFNNQLEIATQNFGRVEEKFLGPLLHWLNRSGFWSSIDHFENDLNRLSTKILGSSDLKARMRSLGDAAEHFWLRITGQTRVRRAEIAGVGGNYGLHGGFGHSLPTDPVPGIIKMIDGVLEKITSTFNFMSDHWGIISKGMEAAGVIWLIKGPAAWILHYRAVLSNTIALWENTASRGGTGAAEAIGKAAGGAGILSRLGGGALAMGGAAAGPVAVAAAAAAAVRYLLSTTNANENLNKRADVAQKMADENERFVQKQTELSLKYDSGMKDMDAFTKALKENEAEHKNVIDTLQQLDDAARAASETLGRLGGGYGGNYGLHGALSDEPNAVYEEYPWEGRSSRRGPQGQDLSKPGEVGLGPGLMKSQGLSQGDWVTFPNHPELGKRQIRESSARAHGVEFYTTHPGEYTNKYHNLKVEKAGGGGASRGHVIHYSPTINLHGLSDHSSLASTLHDHANHMLELLKQADSESYRTSFV